MRNRTPAQRRRWQAGLVVSLFFLAVAAAAGTGWWYARESPPHQGPIVLISVDALSSERLDLDAAGSGSTPAIDALSADGVRFAYAYTHSPQTRPSHASLLTGQLPFEHGVRDDGGYAVRPEARTLAEQLRSRGFATGGAVSSFLLGRVSGVDQGFSFFDATQPESPVGAPPIVARDGLQTYEAAETWMRAQGDRRYFLFLEIDAASADAVVSRVVEHLKQRNLYAGATIIFTAAHGDTELAGQMSAQALSVPLIVKQPALEGAGRGVTVAVQHIDIVPTLLDLVRAPVPGGLRGRSLRPILDAGDGVIAPAPIYSESLEAAWRFGGSPIYVVTESGYRLTRGAADDVTWVGETPAPTLPADTLAARLGAELDEMLAGRSIQPPTDIPSAEGARYAAAGYLPGLRTIQSDVPAVDIGNEPALAAAHRAAIRLVAAGDRAAAITALRGISREHPQLAPLPFQIAVLLTENGRIPEAVTAFAAAAALRPEDPDIATRLAATYLRGRQVADATLHVQEAVTLAERAAAPRAIADAHEVAARVALEASDADAATLHAGEAHDADSSLPLPAFIRGRLAYDAGQYEEALAAFQEAAETLRDTGRELSELQLYVGDALAQLDRFEEAERAFREELRAFPGNLQAYASLAMLYRASNRAEAAGQTIEDLVTAAPTPEGYALAGRLWTIVGRHDRADALRVDARRRFRGMAPPAAAN